MPKKSALERAIFQLLDSFLFRIRTKDRAALIGLILACIPIFPACLFGMLISLFNFILIKRNLLTLAESKIVMIGLFVGILNTSLWLLFFYNFGNIMFLPFEFVRELFSSIDQFIYDLLNGFSGVATDTST